MSDRDLLNTRNIEALAESAKADRARLDELTIVVQGLRATVTSQAQTIQILQQHLAAYTADRGKGRTT